MFTRILLIGAYLFLLAVLLPHTAWMFSLFEPEQATQLGWLSAIAFEITIAALTHFLAKELAAITDVHGEKFGERIKRELLNIPAFLLMGSIVISTVANWTHAYQFGTNVPFSDVTIIKVAYSILYGAALPLCSFAYAYVLSRAYKKPEAPAQDMQEAQAWLALSNYIKTHPNAEVSPRHLARMAGVPEDTASKIIANAVDIGMININGKV